MIKVYTQKRLTFQTDILPARGSGKYYGGLWESTLAQDLLWISVLHLGALKPRRPLSYVAPSFLWASVSGPISFIDVSDAKKFKQTFEIENIQLEPKGGDSLGQLKAGQLTITAPRIVGKYVNSFHEARPTEWLLPGFKSGTECFWATGKAKHANSDSFRHHIYYRDAEFERSLISGEICFVQLFAACAAHDATTYAMVLVKERNTSVFGGSIYRRLGIITTLEKRWFTEGNKEVFHII